MKTVIRKDLELDTPRSDGTTKRATNLALKKSMPPAVWERNFGEQMKPVDFEPECEIILDHFFALSNSRDFTHNGFPMRLKWEAIKSYKDCYPEQEIPGWMIEVIRELDDEYLTTTYKVMKE